MVEGGRGRGGGEEERGRGLDEVCALASRLCELGCRDSGTCSMWGSHDFSALLMFRVFGIIQEPWMLNAGVILMYYELRMRDLWSRIAVSGIWVQDSESCGAGIVNLGWSVSGPVTVRIAFWDDRGVTSGVGSVTIEVLHLELDPLP